MALDAIPQSNLEMDSAQVALFSVYDEANYSMKRLIVEKLHKVPGLSAEVLEMSRDMLPKLNGVQVGDMLGLYRIHKIEDQRTIQEVARLLNSDNKFISGKAYDFLLDFEEHDQSLATALEAYRFRNGQ
jgi:hypothetical protein